MADLKLWCEQELSKLKDNVDKRFEALCSDMGLPSPRGGGLEVETGAEAVTVKAELPSGFPRDKVSISATETALVIMGRQEEGGAGGGATRTFRKEVRLGCRIKPELASATLNGEMLVVTLPKETPLSGKKIEISTE